MVGKKVFPKAVQLARKFDGHFEIHGLPGVASWVGLRCALRDYDIFHTGVWFWLGAVSYLPS